MLNYDVNKRDQLLGIKNDKYLGGIAHFKTLDLETLETLIEEKFIDPNDRQNDSPTVLEFYNFMKKYPSVKAFGYAVSAKRDDYRISLEGLISEPTDDEELINDFIRLCYNADELETNMCLRAWWD